MRQTAVLTRQTTIEKAFGIYQFELKVVDSKGIAARDTISIYVKNNNPPIANAGLDQTIAILSCHDRIMNAELDGSGSVDPENNIIYYNWRFLSGSAGSLIKDQNSIKPKIEKLSSGIHLFELMVTDLGGYSSKDTVSIIVSGNGGIPTPYNLDLTIDASYIFLNNYNNPWEDPIGYYYDYFGANAKASFAPLGEFSVDIAEVADTAELSNVLQASMIQIRTTKANTSLNLDGDLVGINFKQIIRQGGGSFTGGLKINGGSAELCDSNVFVFLPPLVVTGNLNITTGRVSLRVRGNVFF